MQVQTTATRVEVKRASGAHAQQSACIDGTDSCSTTVQQFRFLGHAAGPAYERLGTMQGPRRSTAGSRSSKSKATLQPDAVSRDPIPREGAHTQSLSPLCKHRLSHQRRKPPAAPEPGPGRASLLLCLCISMFSILIFAWRSYAVHDSNIGASLQLSWH